jgi:1-pyrroline-5-carboxylate dehydrogenase
VDSETDIDTAVAGVVAAAFGYQGQKCSACSRAIVDRKIYNEFVKKLKARVDTLKIGPADENFPVGPVSSASAEKSILAYISIGKKEGKLLNGGSKAEGNGFYIQPTVFADIDPMARISQEEIFGPVLAVIKAKDFNDALKIANNTKFGLTGAVYTNNREKLNKARKELLIGISILTGNAPERWWVFIPLAGLICRARIPKPAEGIIWVSSCRQS